MTQVSVIIPSYNHAPFIQEALESVFAQTYSPWECIVVDDGSTDNTHQVLQQIHHPSLRTIFFEKNCGACAAMNHAIQEAKGEYIAVLNSDDRFLPNKLEKQVAILEQHPEWGALFTRIQLIDERGNPLPPTHRQAKIFDEKNKTQNEWLRFFFDVGNALCHPSVLIRKQCYEEIGPLNPTFAQLPDYDFWTRLLFHYPIHILDEPLLQFRILDREKNISAPTQSNQNRSSWERYHILSHYATIPTIEQYLHIFPEEQPNIFTHEPDFIPYYLGRYCLRSFPESLPHRLLGLNLLSNTLQNPRLYDKIQQENDYSYPAFLQETARYPLFTRPLSMRIKGKWNSIKRKFGWTSTATKN